MLISTSLCTVHHEANDVDINNYHGFKNKPDRLVRLVQLGTNH